MKNKRNHYWRLIFPTFILGFFLGLNPLFADPGDLDLTFGGGDGKTIHDLDDPTSSNDYLVDAGIQSDGKIVVLGYSGQPTNSRIARFCADGRLDEGTHCGAGFGVKGIIKVNLALTALAIQDDDRIVAVGYQAGSTTSQDDFIIRRFSANGTLEPSFGGTLSLESTGSILHTDFGNTKDRPNAVALGDDYILAAGCTRCGSGNNLAVAKYRMTDGKIDTSFGDNGIKRLPYLTTSGIDDVAIRSDGAIIAVATEIDSSGQKSFLTAHISANGRSFPDFKRQSFGPFTEVKTVKIQSDGKVIVAGNSEGNFVAIRYIIGSLGVLGVDKTFSGDGKINMSVGGYSYLSDIALQSDQKIILGGYGGGDFVIARLNPDGSLDSSFQSEETTYYQTPYGYVRTDLNGNTARLSTIMIQPLSQKIVTAGFTNGWGDPDTPLEFDWALTRYISGLKFYK